MVIGIRNILLIISLFLATTNSKCHPFKISNEEIPPIDVYTLHSSKFQVKDILDSIVNSDTSLSYKKLTEYIDTFILEKSFLILQKLNDDSVDFFFYFSGDVKEWLQDPDSCLIVLKYLSINGDTYEYQRFKSLRKLEQEKYLNSFKSKIINRLNKQIAILPKYSIHVIDTARTGDVEGKGIVCKNEGKCDTLLLKYVNGGQYTGIKK